MTIRVAGTADGKGSIYVVCERCRGSFDDEFIKDGPIPLDGIQDINDQFKAEILADGWTEPTPGSHLCPVCSQRKAHADLLEAVVEAAESLVSHIGRDDHRVEDLAEAIDELSDHRRKHGVQ